MLNGAEHEKSIITSGPGLRIHVFEEQFCFFRLSSRTFTNTHVRQSFKLFIFCFNYDNVEK